MLRRPPWSAILAAATLVALARAELRVSELGFLAAGALELAWLASTVPFLVTLALSLPTAWLAARTWRRLGDRPLLALAAPVGAAVAFALIVGLPWPLDANSPLGFYDPPGRARTLETLFVSLLAVTMLSPTLPRPLLRPPAALGVLAALVLIARPLLGDRASWPERPNVILVSIDTQRADHLSCYGYERPTSPNIDRFAEHAVRFTRMFTPYPWTLVSHMSLFTSLNPTAHGVSTDRALAPGIPTLAEHMQEAGYHTVGILDTVKWLDPRYHFDRGFDVYQQVRGSAADKHRRISPVLDTLGHEPFFLFLHFFDVHSDSERLPYESLEDYRRYFVGDYDGDFTGCVEGLGCASKLLIAMGERNMVLRGKDLEYLIALYDAGVRTFDRELGGILDELEQRGLFETSIVVLTSDHGEAFFDHGFPLHGGVYDEVVRVPFLVRTPDVREARVENCLLSVIDIAPTLLDLCKVKPSGMQGSSFRGLIAGDGADAGDRPDWVLLEDGRKRWCGIRTERWKALRYENQPWALFDLEADPEEKVNLLRGSAERPPEFLELRDRFEAERERMLEFRRSLPSNEGIRTKGSDRAELEALGYGGEFD